MKKDTFLIKVVDKDLTRVKENDREAFLKCMEGIKAQFADNNEFATRFVEITPKLEEIEIDIARNMDVDIPFIKYMTKDGETKVIYIPRFHRIIWSILLETVR